MEETSNEWAPWESYGLGAPPQHVSRDDPTFLLLLALAAHPDLKLNYEAMSEASFAVPDPRMWTTPANLRHHLRPLERLSALLRDMPSGIDGIRVSSSTSRNRSAAGLTIENGIHANGAPGPRYSQQTEMRAMQVLNGAWGRYVALYNDDNSSMAGNASESPRQDFRWRGSQAPERSRSPESDRSRSLSSAMSQLDLVQEPNADFGYESGHGVWLEQCLNVHERVAASERRAARAAQLAALRRRNNGSSANNPS
uniref:Uncharacterized protein n=1 Tax=Coccidioides posadasii RMSCC 3488 TaxID=454284 RepID=A0A0J6F4S5_COCPO|nr:hypothetical protein CPAG_00632 [Coccidioides posadasii RMSCC 3488]